MAAGGVAIPVFIYVASSWFSQFQSGIDALRLDQSATTVELQSVRRSVDVLTATVAESRAAAVLRDSAQDERIKNTEGELQDIQRYLRDRAAMPMGRPQ